MIKGFKSINRNAHVDETTNKVANKLDIKPTIFIPVDKKKKKTRDKTEKKETKRHRLLS